MRLTRNKKFLSISLIAFLITCCEAKPVKEGGLQVTSVIVADDKKIDSLVTAKIIYKIPDFTQYKDVNQKKKAFFAFIKPMIVEENSKIRLERAKIKTIITTYTTSGVISAEDRKWIRLVATSMRMKTFSIENEKNRLTILRKKDIVPVSMCLAQAAIESSWGTSRFATEANNLFGQWCYTPGCGIVPSQRQPNESNEVRKFATVNAAVKSYVRNINSYYAYENLRLIREKIRNEGKIPDGHSLAKGLIKYSQRGEAYVKEIQAIIRVNKLNKLQ